jgi:hypothetical protein
MDSLRFLLLRRDIHTAGYMIKTAILAFSLPYRG